MNKKYYLTDEELQIIRDLYDGSSLRLSKIMRALGRKYPRHYVRKVASTMGLARVKEPDWTDAEEGLIYECYPRLGLKALQTKLRYLTGVTRSTPAIYIKIRRLGMVATDGEGFTMRGLCDFLWAGQEMHKIIERWVDRGWLKGKRRGTLRTKKQGGDQWYFDPQWVRSFIIAHPEEIDLRLVDPVAFIRLVAGQVEGLAACKCPRCGKTYEALVFNPGCRILRIYCEDCRQSDDLEAEAYRLAM